MVRHASVKRVKRVRGPQTACALLSKEETTPRVQWPHCANRDPKLWLFSFLIFIHSFIYFGLHQVFVCCTQAFL